MDELKQKIKDLENRIMVLENISRPDNIELIDSEIFYNVSGVTSANVLQNYSGSLSGSVNSLAIPDVWIYKTHKGQPYLLGGYSLDKK